VDKGVYQEWVKNLSRLTSGQLNDLSARLKILAPKEHDGKSDFGTRVLQAVCDVMRKNGTETVKVFTLRKSTAYTTSKNKLEDLRLFFEQVDKSRLVQDAILRQAIDLLYHDLVQWKGIAVSSHLVLKQMHRIPSTLHKHFPGYGPRMLVKILGNSQ
jgi:hypothetical protein